MQGMRETVNGPRGTSCRIRQSAVAMLRLGSSAITDEYGKRAQEYQLRLAARGGENLNSGPSLPTGGR